MELSRFLDTYFVSENNLKYILGDVTIHHLIDCTFPLHFRSPLVTPTPVK